MRGDDWNLLELWELAAQACPYVCQESEVTHLLHVKEELSHWPGQQSLLNSSITFHTESDPPEAAGLRQKMWLGQLKSNSSKSLS